MAGAALQRGVREHYAKICRRWQASGVLDPGADPRALADLPRGGAGSGG